MPSKDLTILTGHNDFSYLAQAFDIKIASQLAETGESEPSVRDVQAAVDQARGAGARAVVTSKGEVTQLAEQVAQNLNVPLLQLYADSLSENGEASTLLGAITYNVDQIVQATSGGSVKCPS